MLDAAALLVMSAAAAAHGAEHLTSSLISLSPSFDPIPCSLFFLLDRWTPAVQTTLVSELVSSWTPPEGTTRIQNAVPVEPVGGNDRINEDEAERKRGTHTSKSFCFRSSFSLFMKMVSLSVDWMKPRSGTDDRQARFIRTSGFILR